MYIKSEGKNTLNPLLQLSYIFSLKNRRVEDQYIAAGWLQIQLKPFVLFVQCIIKVPLRYKVLTGSKQSHI